MNPEEIITFWFEETSPYQQFSGDSLFDAKIREKFLTIHGKVVQGGTEDWRVSSEGRLAEIIVLDQFSRNMFRNTPEAFKYDWMALELAQEAVRIGADKELSKEKRYFVYMPYMHSESLEVHKSAFKLFENLGADGLKYEIMHKNIIERFGRYPHRNTILGRISTTEEEKYLKTHSGF